MEATMPLLLRLVALWTLAAAALADAGKSVSVTLEAGWPSHAYSALMEACEFGGESVFWRVLDSVQPRADSPLEQSEAVSLAMEATAPLLQDDLSKRLLKLALELRALAPAVELQRRDGEALWKQIEGGESGAAASSSAQPPRAWVGLQRRAGALESAVARNPAELDKLVAAQLKGLEENEAGCAAPAEGDAFALREGDHVHPASWSELEKPHIVAVLHGVLGTPEFAALHRALETMVQGRARLVYAVRFMPVEGDALASGSTRLQGFGVTMDIKNMEYITVDEDAAKEKGDDETKAEKPPVDLAAPVKGIQFDKLIQRAPGSAEAALVALHAELTDQVARELSENNEIEQIKVWDMGELGMQAATKITASPDPLAAWADLAGNFPVRANALLKIQVPKPLRRAVGALGLERGRMASGKILVNGVRVDVSNESFNVFSLLALVREEAELESLAARASVPEGYDAAAAVHAAAEAMASGAAEGEDGDEALVALRAAGQRVDLRSGAKGAVIFLNNIEKDKLYERWPKDVTTLLRAQQQLAPVRKNLYTSIVVLDPAKADHRAALALIFRVVDQGAPVRFGLTLVEDASSPAPDGECGAACWTDLFMAAVGELSSKPAGLEVLRKLASERGELSQERAVAIFAAASARHAKSRTSAELEALARTAIEEGRGEKTATAMRAYTKAKGITVPSWSVNGLLQPGLRSFQSDFSQLVYQEQRIMTYLVHFSRISDKTDVFKRVLSLSDAVPRNNNAVLRNTIESDFVPLSAPAGGLALPYVLDNTASSEEPVTLWMLASAAALETDDSPERATLLALLRYAATAPAGVRVALLPASQAALDAAPALWRLVLAGPAEDAALKALALFETAGAIAKGGPLSSDEATGRLLDAPHEAAPGLSGRADVLLCNGRELQASADLGDTSDFEMLVSHERKQRTHAVAGALRVLGLSAPSADVIMSVSSVAALHAAVEREDINFLGLGDSALAPLVFSAEPDGVDGARQAKLRVTALVDPLADYAPRVAAVLQLLHRSLGAHVQVVLLPEETVSEFPISSFFRFVAHADEASAAPAAVFAAMPQQQLLTLKVSTPESWLVYPVDTDDMDTDNIMLSREPHDRAVRFELTSLLVSGHCSETGARGAPAGLQLQLGRPEGPAQSDTLVMQNLGYWQLQAGPGVWQVSIAPGRSRELYEIQGGSGASLAYKEVVIRDFAGEAERLVVAKRPGKAGEDLLDGLEVKPSEGEARDIAEAKARGGRPATPQRKPTKTLLGVLFDAVLGPVKRALGLDSDGKSVAAVPDPGRAESAVVTTNETIHVFSLASGALYERFLRIMMVSVRKQTGNPVKFWLIENFLSPSFKASIGGLAAHYGFEYAMVTYKWPHWLRRQTEKQRIIWGYKILFLDVLFPLNVPKVIYVDADQVVRADLKELWDMDLHGHAYGYTPFCASREETLGFQFWRQGYWKDHLQGRPYHISALYVVDLVRFRKMMVGDKLRAVYDQLSRDPNSLSNLDQDLPNYCQNIVPMFSLPQEWLWCESWCSDESKARAKTIDLCNNPLHKEPKLDMAKRVISGDLFDQSWVQLDEEIKGVIAGA